MSALSSLIRPLQRLLAPGRAKSAQPARAVVKPAAPEPGLEAAAALLKGLEACKNDSPQIAYEAFQRAFICYLQADDRRAASLVQKTISLVLQRIQNPAKVRLALKNALRMLEIAGLKDEEARALFFLGDFEAKQRAFKDAYFYYDESLKLSREIGYPAGEAECLCRYARALGWHGRIKEVSRRLDEAAEVAKGSGDPAIEAMVKAWTKRLTDGQSFSLTGVGARKA
jgi:tetratricopeptide (TPR) repeat protein